MEKPNDQVNSKSKGLNLESPHPSLSGNKDAIGFEYGSPNMDQGSTNVGSPSFTSSILNLMTGVILLINSI